MSLIKAAGSGEVSTGFYKHLLDQSLKFNDDDTQYLTRTPASAGNRKTWTFSAWVKRGNLGINTRILGTTYTSNSEFYLRFKSDNTLEYGSYEGGGASNNFSVITTQVFRDVSAWYHIVFRWDTTQSTAANRLRIYVNGEQITAFSTANYPSQNYDGIWNNTTHQHRIGYGSSGEPFDGYMAELNLIDGTSLGPDSFGETKDGIWIPKDTSGLTFGTNGFHLTFKDDVVSEGFNAVTYTGNGGTQSVSGIGFQPDFVWVKERSSDSGHQLVDSVRGAGKRLYSHITDAENTNSNILTSFDGDGFSIGNDGAYNASGDTYVGWCWEAGGAPTADNSAGAGATPTAGSVKIDGSNLGSALAGTIPATRLSADTSKGFSVVTYTGTGSAASVAHGLGAAPKWVIVKNRTDAENWSVFHTSVGNTKAMTLNATDAALTSTNYWNDTSPSASVVTLGSDNSTNGSSDNMVAYCFAEISGYSKFGTYGGSGSSGNSVTGLGFKPAWLMIKSSAGATTNWFIYDNTRQPTNPKDLELYADLNSAEYDSGRNVTFTNDGFDLDTVNYVNNSGVTYIYMAFADTREAAFFKDVSTNGNNWTPVNLDYRDSVPDVPTNNFCTGNPLKSYNGGGGSPMVYSEGNLKLSRPSGATGWASSFGSMSVSSGKWFWEALCFQSGSADNVIGVHEANTSMFQILGYSNDPTGYGYNKAGNKLNDSTGSSYGATYTDGDVIGVALDMDAGTVAFYKNGASQGTAFTGLSGDFIAGFSSDNGNGAGFWIANFGQDSSFAGNHATANSNADGEGYGSFAYAPPSGYLALCSQNLPDPAIIDGSEYFNTVLWTGDGSQTRSLTGVNFQPDFSWLKIRSGTTQDHQLYDSVRGAGSGKNLSSNTTAVEGTVNEYADGDYGFVSSFDADGFSVNDGATATNGGYVNYSGRTYAAWNWLAGTAFSNDASATGVGTIDSSGQVNTTAGFSIVSYTGTGSAGTIAHGLSAAPDFLIIRRRDPAEAWPVWVGGGGFSNTQYLRLNGTNAVDTATTLFNSTTPTSSVVTLGSGDFVNTSTKNYIMYAFHSVEGYSKVGSYVGNGTTGDGTFVFLGFRPSFVLFKRTDAVDNWVLEDSARNTSNINTKYLLADTNGTEGTVDLRDFLSNGFKMRGSAQNASGGNYIYLAFAESPFKFANAR